MSEANNQNDNDKPTGLWDTLLMDVRIATMRDSGSYGVIEHGAIGISAGRIVWAGAVDALSDSVEKLAKDAISCGNIWVTPGMIDCHTHLVYAGHNHPYAESVVQATRSASQEQLLENSGRRLVSFLEEGTTAIGVTFGYGPDKEIEAKLIEALAQMQPLFPMHFMVQLEPTRTVPETYAGDREAFSEEGVKLVAAAGKAVHLFPGVFYTLAQTQKPLVASLRAAGVPMVLSTDCNPISSPCTSLLLMMNMAYRLFGLTPLEALQGVTRHAATALGVQEEIGTIEVGKMADLALWSIDHPDELSNCMGYNPCLGILTGGVLRRTHD